MMIVVVVVLMVVVWVSLGLWLWCCQNWDGEIMCGGHPRGGWPPELRSFGSRRRLLQLLPDLESHMLIFIN